MCLVYPNQDLARCHTLVNYTVLIVLYCTVLYCKVLYCTVPYCTAEYSTVLHSTVFYSTVLHSTLLYRTVLHSNVLHSTTCYCIILTMILHGVTSYQTILSLLYCTSERWSTGKLLKSLNWLSIQQILTKETTITIHKIVNTRTPTMMAWWPTD